MSPRWLAAHLSCGVALFACGAGSPAARGVEAPPEDANRAGPCETAGSLPTADQLCTIETVRAADGAVFFTACGRPLRLASDHIERLDFCHGGFPNVVDLLALGPDTVVVHGLRCDLHQRTTHGHAHHWRTTWLPRANVVVRYAGRTLVLERGDGTSRLQLAREIRELLTSDHDPTIVGVQLEDRATVLVDVTGERARVGFGPGEVHLPYRHFQWRGARLLADERSDLTVRPTSGFGPVVSIPRDAQTAVLSHDGRWVATAYGLVRVFSADDASLRWSQQAGQGQGEPDALEWTPDGGSIALVFPRFALRLEAASGEPLGSLDLASASARALSPDARTLAFCVPTRPGEPDELHVTHLRTDRPPRPPGVLRDTGPYSRGADLQRWPLADGDCAASHLTWLDADTVALHGVRLRIRRGERELVSLAFAERGDELWGMDETRVLARLGPDARQPLR